MLLAYLDESFTKDYFFIAAVIVEGKHIQSLEHALDDVVHDAYDAYPDVRPDSELHGHPLFHGEADWSSVQPRARIGIYAHAFQALADHDVAIILRGLDCKRQRARYVTPDPPHEIVLQHVMERVNAYAKRRDECVLLIADEVHEHERHRANLRDFRSLGTPGYRSSRLPNIVDTIHFAPSCFSRLVQAADLVAFLHRRRTCHAENDPRAKAANDRLWARIAPQVEHDHIWRP